MTEALGRPVSIISIRMPKHSTPQEPAPRTDRGVSRTPTPATPPPPPRVTDQGKGKGRSVVRPMGTVAYRGKGQGKGKGRGEGRLGQGGRGRSKAGEKLMGTTAYGGKGSKGRAANGDRPVGAASCRRDHHTMASCQNPRVTSLRGLAATGYTKDLIEGVVGGWAAGGRGLANQMQHTSSALCRDCIAFLLCLTDSACCPGTPPVHPMQATRRPMSLR